MAEGTTGRAPWNGVLRPVELRSLGLSVDPEYGEVTASVPRNHLGRKRAVRVDLWLEDVDLVWLLCTILVHIRDVPGRQKVPMYVNGEGRAPGGGFQPHQVTLEGDYRPCRGVDLCSDAVGEH